MSPHLRRTLVVVGHGMVGHRFVQAAIERGLTERYDVLVVGEEPRPAYDRVPRVFDALHETLVDLFPVVKDAAITHRWGGALGIARDWTASVGVDPDTGIGWAGVLLFPAVWSRSGLLPVLLLAVGGLLYTVGAIGFGRRWPTLGPKVFSYHEVWHAFTIAAAAAHLAAIWIVAT